jgi:hypothetical protein
LVKEIPDYKRLHMLANSKLIFALAATCLMLGGCRASPLYIGTFGQQKIAMAPGAVPRDGRGEPIMADLPPLGALPAAEARRTR